MKKYIILLLISFITGMPMVVFSAGYQMRYQSAETMGTGFASDVTNAKTASGFFNNPAIIAFMDEGKHFSAEFTTLIPSGSFEGQTAYSANTASQNADNFGSTSILPSLYYGQKVADKMFVTATLSVPWATKTDYGNEWIGRYQATNTELTTYNLTTSFVYSVNEKLAVAGGLQLQYADGNLGRAVDTDAFGGTAALDDLIVGFEGDHLGYGLAFSTLYKHSDALRFGFQYKGQVKHTLSGKQTVDPQTPTAAAVAANPGIIAAGLGNGQSVETEITIPNNITLGASYLLNNSLDLHGSLSWTGWSSFERLTVTNNSTNTSSFTQIDWKDTVFLAFGTDYYMNQTWTLRSGLSFETGAPPDDKRTPRGVDEDRLGLNFGASYKLSETLDIHGAFTQIVFLDKPSLDLPEPAAVAPPAPRLTGEYTTTASLIRLGISAKF